MIRFIIAYFISLLSYNTFAQIVDIKDETIPCSAQPYKRTEINRIHIENVRLDACNNASLDNYSEIISTNLIRIRASNTNSRYLSGTVVRFAIEAPYEDTYVHAERELSSQFIPVMNNLKIVYNEQYLDNIALEYTIYRYKGDPQTYTSDFYEVIVSRGDNYIEIPISSLPQGLYIIEIIDQKDIPYYVRFNKI